MCECPWILQRWYFTCLKTPHNNCLENIQLLKIVMKKKRITIAVRAPAKSSAQAPKSCDDLFGCLTSYALADQMETSVSPENQDRTVPKSSLTSCHEHKPGNEASTGQCLLWQSLSCPSPSWEISLSPQHKHKQFCRAHAVKCTVEPWFSYSLELATFSCCRWFAAQGFKLCLVSEMQLMKAREFWNREICYMQNTN